MPTSAMTIGPDGTTASVAVDRALAAPVVDDSWTWFDIEISDETTLLAVAERLSLDPLAVRDAIEERDLPKFDDFGSHGQVVLHELSPGEGLRCITQRVNCFVLEHALVTVRQADSPSVKRLAGSLQRMRELASGGPSAAVARLAHIISSHLLSVVEALDDAIDEATDRALRAEPSVMVEVAAARAALRNVRHAARPQRDLLHDIGSQQTAYLSSEARRRFADAADAADRLVALLDTTRAGLGDVLEAYRGAEARHATDVSRVLTVYAALMLPLSLVVGFFGMNFEGLPLTGRSWGWIVVLVAMIVVFLVSLGVFVAVGWVRPWTAKSASAVLTRGVAEASRAQVELVGSLFEALNPRGHSSRPRLGSRAPDQGSSDRK